MCPVVHDPDVGGLSVVHDPDVSLKLFWSDFTFWWVWGSVGPDAVIFSWLCSLTEMCETTVPHLQRSPRITNTTWPKCPCSRTLPVGLLSPLLPGITTPRMAVCPTGKWRDCSTEMEKSWEVSPIPPAPKTPGLFYSSSEVFWLMSPPWLLDGCSVLEQVPFSVMAHNVVLATGTHDIPARLGVEGESLPYVCHSFWELEMAISRGELHQSSDPVLVVGAGLTAADAVLAAHHLTTPVYHVFRRSVTDSGLIFNQLPKLLYPEYHKVRWAPDLEPEQHLANHVSLEEIRLVS